jgi:glyoxylase-like metal-dependent hydrolase (beta-lactamase superfamily II)
MKVYKLETNPGIYSSNAYLILGDWNKLEDINALVDTGSDPFIQGHIKRINTGVGKVQLDKIILTHTHFDHIGGVDILQKLYGCQVLAYTKYIEKIRLIHDGEILHLGDNYFEVIHAPGHSSDSICLYNKSEGILFSGDTQIRINSTDGTYTPEFVNTIKRLAELKISIIYPGHGDPLKENPEGVLQNTLKTVEQSRIYSPQLKNDFFNSSQTKNKKFNYAFSGIE